jgi:RNA polymerase sigma-70 factor (ECF subfamily)
VKGEGVEWVTVVDFGSARAMAETAEERPRDLLRGADRASAFRELVGNELDRSYRRAAVILGDRFEAEDAVHDAAERAWRHWPELRDPARFDAWFGRILVNACRDRLRHQRRVRAIEVVREPLDDEHPAAPDATEAVGLRSAVRDAFRALSADEQIVIALRYEEDLTVPAIARLVGIAEGTVKSRLHNALRKLRAGIGGPI